MRMGRFTKEITGRRGRTVRPGAVPGPPGVIAVGFLYAPVLSGDANQNTPSVVIAASFDATAAENDVITVVYSDDDFATEAEATDTLSLAEIGALTVSITIPDLTAGTWKFKAIHIRASPAATSSYSNTLTVTMAEGTFKTFMTPDHIYLTGTSDRHVMVGSTMIHEEAA